MKAEVLADIQPYFDMELFMSISQETRIGGEVMERLAGLWESWVPHAKVKILQVEEASYLLVWLGEVVERSIDEAWQERPSDSFLFNALAQVMCMTMVHAAVPQVEDAGCAAAPPYSDALAKALQEAGVPYAQEGEPGLSRRYAVVTFYPFKGGCEVCALRTNCPKGSGCGGDAPSVLLPGHEN